MRSRLAAVLTAFSVCSVFVPGTATVAEADVGYSQQAVLKDEAPESGRLRIKYKNYSEMVRAGCTGDGYCDGTYYRKSEGALDIKLSTFRIKDGRPKYAYFLLDVDVLNAEREGSSENGWFSIQVRHKGATVVDYANTKSSSFDKDRDCKEVAVGLSTPWPIVAASMSLGHVRFCDEGARYTKKQLSGNGAEFFAGNARDVVHVSNQRVVKVLRRDNPVFVVKVSVPTDDCTSLYDGYIPALQSYCDKYDNEVSSRKIRIGTSG